MSNEPFRLDISAFVAKAKGDLHAITHRVVADVASRIIERTPVGDPDLWASRAPAGYVGGRARSNWQLGINVPVSGELYNAKDKGFPNASATLAAITDRIPADAGGKTYFISNNLPYAQRLEDGWSSQAPRGMVHLAVIEWQQIIAAAAADTTWQAPPA